MKFDELYKKVINASKAFEERHVPIRLDFKIEDLRDALVESNVTIEKLVSAKKSAEQILKNLLDCGLIKEWYFNGKFNAVLKADDPHLQIAELKKKLEDAKATAYAEMVDANMENRRLKRALYKVCDNWAVCEMDYWRKCLEHYEDYFNVRTDEDLTEEKCERMIDNWRKVAHNCRARAEEYK